MTEKWNIGLPGGPSGPFYSIVSSTGRVIALQIPDREIADRICQLPELETENARLININARGATNAVHRIDDLEHALARLEAAASAYLRWLRTGELNELNAAIAEAQAALGEGTEDG